MRWKNRIEFGGVASRVAKKHVYRQNLFLAQSSPREKRYHRLVAIQEVHRTLPLEKNSRPCAPAIVRLEKSTASFERRSVERFRFFASLFIGPNINPTAMSQNVSPIFTAVETRSKCAPANLPRSSSERRA